MGEFDHIKRCIQLAERDIATAVDTRELCKGLLDHLAEVSKPNDGAPKLLLVFARMSTSACDWIDGDLRVEIVGDGDVSVIELMCDLGAGMKERVLPPFVMKVPLAEFIRAVERVPHMINPLQVKTKTPRRVVFAASAEVRKTTVPPPFVEIGEDSLFQPPTAPKMPKV